MVNSPGTHCKNRMFEWTMTGALLLVGLLLVFWPDATRDVFLAKYMRPEHFFVFYLALGGVRAFALFRNGKWPVYGPLFRAAGSLLGALVWGQMVVVLVSAQIAVAGLFVALVVAELFSTYRALADARYR